MNDRQEALAVGISEALDEAQDVMTAEEYQRVLGFIAAEIEDRMGSIDDEDDEDDDDDFGDDGDFDETV